MIFKTFKTLALSLVLAFTLSGALTSCAPPMSDPKTVPPGSNTNDLPSGTTQNGISAQVAAQMAGTYQVTLQKREWNNSLISFNTQMIVRNHQAEGQRWMSIEINAVPQAGGSTVNIVKYLGISRSWSGDYILMSGSAEALTISDYKFSVQMTFPASGGGISPYNVSADLLNCSFSNSGYCQNQLSDAWFASDLRRL